MNNLYLNQRKIQPKKDNNICKEYNDASLYTYLHMPVWSTFHITKKHREGENKNRRVERRKNYYHSINVR